MKFTLVLFALTLLFSSNSGNAQTDCKEEKVRETYFRICSKNIVTEKNKLSLKTNAVAIADSVSNKNTLKLVHYYVEDRKRGARTKEEAKAKAKAKSTDKAYLEYKKFLNDLETLPFFVNGKKFTGVLKMGIPYKNGGFRSTDSGYDIIIYEFNEGVFVSKRTLRDVHLESETGVMRPT